LYWLPKFFAARYSLNIKEIGLPLVTVYAMAIVGGIFGGALPGVFLRRGISLNVSRKATLATCAALMIPVAFATKAPTVWIATFLIGFGMAALQGWAANCYTVVSDLFPKHSVASVVGIGTFFGSLAGIAYAELAGEVLEKSGNYLVLFVLAGIACPVGILSLHLLVPHWTRAELPDPETILS
jgi:ACS family hexuronate transporter-like MFS transporter